MKVQDLLSAAIFEGRRADISGSSHAFCGPGGRAHRKAAKDSLGENFTNLGIAEPSDDGPIVGNLLTPTKPTLLRGPSGACKNGPLWVSPIPNP